MGVGEVLEGLWTYVAAAERARVAQEATRILA
jgi:hypothetical protein